MDGNSYVPADSNSFVSADSYVPADSNSFVSADIWSAIKVRFGGNAESTRMRRSLLKHQFEEYKASEEEGLDGGYGKMQKILSKINTLKILQL
nr:ribonuclease H-like domain-containing protein [Tanacetum cinerariifolium]